MRIAFQNSNILVLTIFAAMNEPTMEEWELDFEWLRVRHFLKDRFGQRNLPELNAVLFLIGMQELGQARSEFTKEEKQDLMHIAVCELLSFEGGYYEFQGRDGDGWPHYKLLRPIGENNIKGQATLLKTRIVHYFRGLLEEE